MFNVPKIDSLKLRIPRHLVEFIDPTFCEEFQRIYVGSGMIEETINLEKHKINITNGIKTRIAVVFSTEGAVVNEYVVIQANAKQLKERYLEGITLHNVEYLYNYIMQLQVIYLSFETFMHEALVSDFDIAYDIEITPHGLSDAISAIYSNIIPSVFRLVGKPFRKKTNTGLQFNVRDKATPTRPFVKIYHKSLELEFNSSDFFQAYMKGQKYKNIGRLEFTVKNYKHRQKLGIVDIRTFAQLLTAPVDDLSEIAFSGVLCYINKKEMIREYADLSPTDRLILYFINEYISKGADKQSVFNVLNIFSVPQESSRMKKKLNVLMNHVADEKKMIANTEAMNFLRQLKIQV